MISATRFRSLIGDISEVWRKPVVDRAAAELVPLAVELASTPTADPSRRDQFMAAAEQHNQGVHR